MIQYEQLFHWMKKPWLIAFYTLLVVFTYHFIDKPLAIYLHQIDTLLPLSALKLLTFLGKWLIYLPLFFFAGLYFRYLGVNPLYELRAWYLLSCMLISNFSCLILKVAFGRARPDLLFSSNQFGFYGCKFSSDYWSFPSGHTVTAITLAIGLGVLVPQYSYRLLLAVLLVAASRVLLGDHYLSDVMCTFYGGFLAVSQLTQQIKSTNRFKKAFS